MTVRGATGRRVAPRVAMVATVVTAMVAMPAVAHASARVTIATEPHAQTGVAFRVDVSVDVVNEQSPQIGALDFGGLQVLSDPSPPAMPTMQGFGFGFGGGGAMVNTTLQTSNTYVVMATQPGRYTIRGADVRDGRTGRVVGRAAPVTVVVDGGAVPTPSAGGSTALDAPPDNGNASKPRDPDEPPAGELTGASFSPNAFLRVALDPPSPYLGQQATLRVWLYTTSTEAACELTREPGLVGFWNDPLLAPSRNGLARWFQQQVGDRSMAIGLVRRIALFPTQTGALTIGPPRADVRVAGGGFFRAIQSYELDGVPLSVTVREPPLAGRPANYVPGTVGPATLSVQADRLEVATGETITLTVHATSEGSLASARLDPPAAVDGVRFRVGDARTAHDTSTGRVITSLVREILVVGERPGHYELGTIELPYWDPVNERYDVARATVPAVTVHGEALAPEHGAAGSIDDPLGELHGFRTNPSLEPARTFVPSAALVWLVLLGAPVAFALALLARRIRLAVRERVSQRALRDRTDPRALLASARRSLADAPGEAVTLAARALDQALARHHRRNPGALLPEAATVARERRDSARFAGESVPADELVALVEKAVAALEAV